MLIKHVKQELKNYYHMVTKINLEKDRSENKWQELKQQ